MALVCLCPSATCTGTYSTPNACDHAWAIDRITAQDIINMGILPDVLSQTEKEKVEKAMVNAFLLINNFIAEIRAGRGPLSHKCLIGRPCSHAWG